MLRKRFPPACHSRRRSPHGRYATCPPLDTETEQRALVGRRVLVAHDSEKATGWFIGTVRFFGVSDKHKDKEKCPTATHKILYYLYETDNTLQGMEVREPPPTSLRPGPAVAAARQGAQGARLGGWLGGWMSAAGHFKREKTAANFYRERAGHPCDL